MGAPFRIDGFAPQILLVKPEIDNAAGAKNVDDESLQPHAHGKNVQAGLVEDADDLAEKHIDAARSFLNGGEQAEHASEHPNQELDNESGKKHQEGGNNEVVHRFISR